MTLTAHLAALEGAGLIQLAALQPELEYLFRHVLVKEAAYQSLVKADRRALHRAVAETLEQLHAPSGPSNCALPTQVLPLLGLHFAEADDAGRALRYYAQAGDAAAEVYANAEAISHYTQALGLAGPGLDRERLIHLYVRRGRAMELSGQYGAAVANYETMQAAAVELGDQPMEITALSLRATVHAIVSDVFDAGQARQLAEAALARARAVGLPEAEARLLWVLLLAHLSEGKTAEAIAFGEQSLAIARQHGLTDQMAQTLTDLGRAYGLAGRRDASRAAVNEARQHWRAGGNLSMLAEATTTLGTSHYFVGEYETALTYLTEAYTLSRSIGNAWGQAYPLMMQCYILMDTGQISAGLACIQESLELSRAAGFMVPQISMPAYLGLTYAELGDTTRARTAAQDALRKAEAYRQRDIAAVYAVLAVADLRDGEPEKAAQLLSQGYASATETEQNSLTPYILGLVQCEIDLAQGAYNRLLATTEPLVRRIEALGAASLMPAALRYRGQALLALGRLDEAEAELERARTLAAGQGARRSLWPVLALLAAVAEQRGQGARAQELRAEALGVIDFMAEHIDEPDLRRSFLADPRIQALRAAGPEQAV